MIDFGLVLSYTLVFVAVIGASVFPLALAIQGGDLAGLKKMGISLAIIVTLFVVCMAFAGSEVTDAYTRVKISIPMTETVSKMVGGGLIMMYVSTFIAIAGIIYTEISNLFK